MKWQAGLNGICFGLLAGGILGVLLMYFSLAGGQPSFTPLLAAIGIPAGLSGLAGLLFEQHLAEAAASVDERYRLKDRVQSALEFAEQPPSAPRLLQMEDALNHLRLVVPADVIPIRVPRNIVWAAMMVLLGALAPLIPHQSAATVPAAALPTIVTEQTVMDISSELAEIEEQATAANDPDLQDLVKRLGEDLKQMEQPRTDARSALSRISEMQQKMREMVRELNTAEMDAQLSDVAEALDQAESLRPAADALKAESFDKAADALESASAENLEKAESEPLGDKLAQSAEKARERGLDKLAETLENMATAGKSMNKEQLQQSSQRLADQVRRHDLTRKVSQLLESKSEALSHSKRNLAAQSNSEGNGSSADATGMNLAKGKSNRKSEGASQKAGSKSAGNIHGEKSQRVGELQMARLNGKLGDQGDSLTEKMRITESDQQASRLARETYAEYRKMSEAVLQSEPIPYGQRNTIRRYFELIRPTEAVAEESADAGHEVD